MKAIALDVGDRYIGVAATDHTDPIAYRYATIDRTTQDAFGELAAIIKKTSSDTLIIGVPYHVEDGSETNQTHKTRAFIGQLAEKLGSSVRIIERDETLTSQQARHALLIEGSDVTQEHAEAARIILQEFLTHGI